MIYRRRGRKSLEQTREVLSPTQRALARRSTRTYLNSVHAVASQVTRNLLDSPTKAQEGIVRERQAKYGRKDDE